MINNTLTPTERADLNRLITDSLGSMFMGVADTAGHAFHNPKRFPDKAGLKERLNSMDVSFSEKLLALIDERGLKDSEVYKSAGITKQAFSKLRFGKRYHPKKKTVLAFSIALKLTLWETEELLASAGYALSYGDKTDIIVSYFIEKGDYDIHKINCALYEYGEAELGGM